MKLKKMKENVLFQAPVHVPLEPCSGSKTNFTKHIHHKQSIEGWCGLTNFYRGRHTFIVGIYHIAEQRFDFWKKFK